MVNYPVSHLGSLLAWHAYLVRLANKHLISGCMSHVLLVDL
jgi:hypothetical protein